MKAIRIARSLFNPPSSTRGENLDSWRERILTALLGSAAVLGLLAFLATAGSLLQRGQWTMLWINSASYAWLLLITLLRRLPYRLRAGSGLLLLFAIGAASLLDNALSGSGRVFLIAFVAVSGLLMGLRAGLAAVVLSTAALAAAGFLMNSGRLPLPPPTELANSTRLDAWIFASVIFFLLSSIVVIPLAALVRGLEGSLRKEQALIAELEVQRAGLEEQVQQRTQDLQQRLLQIRAASELAYIVDASTGLAQLLKGAADLITRCFDFRRAEIFLGDQNSKHPLLLEYASSEENGREWKPVSAELPPLPAEVIRTNQVLLPQAEAGQEPEPGAAAGIPIAAGGEAIGALLVRAESPAALSSSALDEIQVLCSQLATAIQKLRLQEAAQYSYEDMQKRLKILETLDAVSHAISIETDLNSLYRVIHEQVARVIGDVDFMIALYRRETGLIEVPYAYEVGEFLQIPPFPLGQGLTSILIRSGEPLLLGEDAARQAAALGALVQGAAPESWLGVPLLVGGSAIGAMIVQDPKTGGRFTEEDRRMLENMAAQIAVMVRNTRLLEEARQRAEREHTINAITSQIRSQVDLQSVVRATADELAGALGARRVKIELAPRPEAGPEGPQANGAEDERL